MPKLKPLHPGEVLREESLLPLRHVGRIGVPRTRIERLAIEQVELSANTALRLARYFGTSADFWMALKSRHERERAEDALGNALRYIKPSDAA
jgi:antitoxin HigA-1